MADSTRPRSELGTDKRAQGVRLDTWNRTLWTFCVRGTHHVPREQLMGAHLSLFDRRCDGSDVVIHQNHVCSLLGNVRTRYPHGYPDVSGLRARTNRHRGRNRFPASSEPVRKDIAAGRDSPPTMPQSDLHTQHRRQRSEQVRVIGWRWRQHPSAPRHVESLHRRLIKTSQEPTAAALPWYKCHQKAAQTES